MRVIGSAEMHAIPAVETSSANDLVRSPVVSVVMMTFNHEAYVRQAIESVIAQECAFEFEILIGDDASTDSTAAICFALQAEHPALIRVIHSERNVGIVPNFLRLICRARGRYVALLEGDDYWTNTKKLARQVQFLHERADCSWCGTRTANRTLPIRMRDSYGLTDVLRRYIVHTSSVMFRTAELSEYPAFPDDVADAAIFAYLSSRGLCGFIDEEMSYYRRHDGGVWTGSDLNAKMKKTWSCVDSLDEYFEGKYGRELADREVWIYEMEMHPRLERPVAPQWSGALNLLSQSFTRVARRSIFGALRLVVGTVVLPFRILYYRLRRRLSLRQRLMRLLGRTAS